MATPASLAVFISFEIVSTAFVTLANSLNVSSVDAFESIVVIIVAAVDIVCVTAALSASLITKFVSLDIVFVITLSIAVASDKSISSVDVLIKSAKPAEASSLLAPVAEDTTFCNT